MARPPVRAGPARPAERRRFWALGSVLLLAALVLARALPGLAAPPEPDDEGVLASLPPPGLYLSPASVTAAVDDTFDLQLMASCGYKADAAASLITFDPSRLEVVSLTPDATRFARGLPGNGFDNVAGRVVYDAGSLTCHRDGNCPYGAIRLATLTLRVVSAGGPTTVAVQGKVCLGGTVIFDGAGTGSLVSQPAPAYRYTYLPLVLRGAGGPWCDAYEPNDSFTQAFGPLASGTSYSARLCVGDPDDLYYFNLPALHGIAIDLTNVPPGTDYDLSLWSSSQVLLAQSRNGGNANEHIGYTPSQTGKYYVRVYPYSGRSDTQSYSLVVTYQ